MSTSQKAPYICGALTELDPKHRDEVKEFYVRLGDACRVAIGVRGFVPHEHYDPIKNASAKNTVVYSAERRIVTEETSVLIVYAIEPSWGAGIEVGWANEHHVPILVLVPEDKKVSRLLTGGPMVSAVISVRDYDHAVLELKAWLLDFNESRQKRAEADERMHRWEMASEDPCNKHPLRCETLDSIKGKAASG
ncbi:MAG: hypothetical protein P1P90_04000 [Patescibacteria group bacterium]|nr:hypothetical protein [Patescibacteria group bacterium]